MSSISKLKRELAKAKSANNESRRSKQIIALQKTMKTHELVADVLKTELVERTDMA